MTYLRLDPFKGFEKLTRRMANIADEFDKGFSIEYGPFAPRIDISEDENNLYFTAELPGVKKEDVKVTVSDDKIIYFKGSKKSPYANEEVVDGEVQKPERTYIRAERAYGDFTRSFTLPDNINKDSISAKYDDGILTVTLAKIEPVKPKQIEVSID
ncbi:MAG: Hsp20/alpha crystallin family protein [Candidatus Kapabacteria bacterium]|nr:Hsp20/alpha crystallin family protein [Candidatus Kapabacteria bacterium]